MESALGHHQLEGSGSYDLYFFLRNNGLLTQMTCGVFLIFSAKTCPGNMIYRESGSPCMDTCSHLEISSLCEEHYMDGCFCPEGKCISSSCMCMHLYYFYLFCIRKQNKNKSRSSSKEGIIKILNVIKLYFKIIIATHYFELNSRTYCQI